MASRLARARRARAIGLATITGGMLKCSVNPLACTYPNHATTTFRSATYSLISFAFAEAKLTTADAEKVFAVRQQEKMKVLAKSAENRLTAKLEASEEARELALEERTVLETLLSAAEDQTARTQPQRVPHLAPSDAALWLLVCPWAVIDDCLRASAVPQLCYVAAVRPPETARICIRWQHTAERETLTPQDHTAHNTNCDAWPQLLSVHNHPATLSPHSLGCSQSTITRLLSVHNHLAALSPQSPG